jgi:hypothetical protein
LDIGVKNTSIPIPNTSDFKSPIKPTNTHLAQKQNASMPKTSEQSSQLSDRGEDGRAGKSWNTKNLPYRLMADAAASLSAAALVTPLIATIDKYVLLDGEAEMLTLGQKSNH